MLREELTARELRFVFLLSTGMRMKQIADMMGITYPYIRHAFQRIYEKTGTADRLELVTRYAWEELAPK